MKSAGSTCRELKHCVIAGVTLHVVAVAGAAAAVGSQLESRHDLLCGEVLVGHALGLQMVPPHLAH